MTPIVSGPITLGEHSPRRGRLAAARSILDNLSALLGLREAGAASIAHPPASTFSPAAGAFRLHLERPPVSDGPRRRRISARAIAVIRCAISLIGASSCSSTKAPVSLSPMAAEASARISAGMTRLGATVERSDCYASQIAAWLTESEQSEAVKIIEASNTKEDMRSGVLAAPNRVRQSFIRAHFGCSLY